MRSIKFLLIAIGIVLGFSACEREISTELQEVHWDRDMCERCKMVVSDRKHAVQVINVHNGRTYMFDDIGCAVLWFDDANIAWSKEAKIWIADIISGKWIDARKALYDTSNITPMAYGFAAHEHNNTIEPGEEVIDFEEASRRVFMIEAKKNRRTY